MPHLVYGGDLSGSAVPSTDLLSLLNPNHPAPNLSALVSAAESTPANLGNARRDPGGPSTIVSQGIGLRDISAALVGRSILATTTSRLAWLLA